MASIKIEGMQFYAYHGCFEEESIVGTHFRIDCRLEVEIKEAAMHDNLEKTINYQTVYQLIAKEMETSSSLLEHVAYRILKGLHEYFPLLQESWVSVEKLNPPLGGKIEKVAVEMKSSELFD